ncbi:MAG: acyl-CoA thioester hydrolase/BAAT C-terminal domain-containing protein [Hyphomonadaceae bacterium]
MIALMHARRLAAAAVLAMTLCSCTTLAQTPGAPATATVTVTVENVRSDGGQITGSLCNDPKATFCSTYVARTKAVPGRSMLVFEGVAPGRYALSTVHDENGNGRTEVPPEGYGFGNNSPAPMFDLSSIDVAGDKATTVSLNYYGATRVGSRGVDPPEGVVRTDIRDDGLYAELYAPKNVTGRVPAVILIDGSTPGLDGVSVLAASYAREGVAALALAYFGETGLPPALTNINLEYFDAALATLKTRGEIDPSRIGVLGVSRGSEAAFLFAARNPDIRAIAAVGPSAVIWQGYDPADPGASVPAWKAGAQPFPFLAADASLYDPNGPQAPMFISALAKLDTRADVLLPVDKINGPLLLMSGQEDRIWPSADMAQRIEARLLKAGFAHDVENVVYAGAGHSVLGSQPEAIPRTLAFFKQALGN